MPQVLAETPPTVTPRVMRAAVITAPGLVEVQQVALREPSTNEVRVRVESCGVCASNVPPWEGRPWFTYPMEPGTLGHEASGFIDAVGADVAQWKRGDRVAFLGNNGYAEFEIVPAEGLIAIPPELDGHAFPGEPLGCAMNIFARSAIREGDVVAIIGIGFLGALLVQLARHAGARVIAIARRSFALEIARELGAEPVVLGDPGEVVRRVQEIAGGRLCDVTIEATGKQAPLSLAAELSRERGRLVVAGFHQDGPREVNMQLWNWRGLDVINAHEREPAIYLSGMRAALEAVRSGRINPAPLFTHHFPLESLGEALALTRDRPDGFMKALVTP
ncbi:MAG TPA: zinc-binding dehydrogenase [Chthoniobacteraceae bacterium]|jgi:threonine dehydrogenase-like Zn-dependent dehydrogenase|nr:zinc-binding dehydrogenase [Chthoniobacteraceae bacterium]